MMLPKVFNRTSSSSPAIDKKSRRTDSTSTSGAVKTSSSGSNSSDAQAGKSGTRTSVDLERPLPSRTSSSSAEKKSASKGPKTAAVAKDRSKDILKGRKAAHSPRPPSKSQSRDKFDPDSHPLNLPPEELRRLSHLSRLSANLQAMGDDETPSSPAAQTQTTQTNGAQNGAGVDKDSAPAPPPHKTPSSPPPPPAPTVDAEACKAAGNKFFKAREYEKAIKEYSKGVSLVAACSCHFSLFYFNLYFPIHLPSYQSHSYLFTRLHPVHISAPPSKPRTICYVARYTSTSLNKFIPLYHVAQRSYRLTSLSHSRRCRTQECNLQVKQGGRLHVGRSLRRGTGRLQGGRSA